MSGIRIIDSHMHLGEWDFFTHGAGLKGILNLMDRLEIGRAYSTHQLWFAARFKEAREESVRAYHESDGRIPFLAGFDPRYPADSLSEIGLCAKEEGFLGIKIHPSFHETPADDAGYRVIWEYVESNGLPLLSHTWSDTYNPIQRLSQPKLFEEYADKYQSVKFVLGHSGGPGNGRQQAVDLARKHPNVYLDTAGDLFSYGFLKYLVENVGAHKILFGTDQPMMDPRCQVVRTYLAGLDSESKELIFYKNALAVYEPRLLEEEKC